MLISHQTLTESSQAVEVESLRAEPEVEPVRIKKKVIIGHLRDNPLEYTLPDIHEVVGAQIHPTPTQKMSEPFNQHESDHSIPSPQAELANEEPPKGVQPIFDELVYD